MLSSTNNNRKQTDIVKLTPEIRNAISNIRKVRNQSLKEFSKENGIGINLLNKIENDNKLEHIKRSTFEALTKQIGLHFDIEGEEIKPKEWLWRFGFGHTLWASACVNALFKNDSFYNFKVYSFSGTPSLNRVESSKINSVKMIKSGYDGILNSQIEIIAKEDIVLYNAADLMKLLVEDKLDAIVVPKNILDHYTSSETLIRVGDLVYSASGSTVISVFFNKPLEKLKSASPAQLCDFIKDNNIQKVKVLYPRHTICADHWSFILKYVLAEVENIEIDDSVEININEIEHCYNEIVVNNNTITLLLGWYPNNYWVDSYSKSKKKTDLYSVKIDLFKEVNEDSYIEYFQFSLILKKDPKTLSIWKQSGGLHQLIESLNKSVTELKNEQKHLKAWQSIKKSGSIVSTYSKHRYLSDNTSDIGLVPRIAQYFDLPVDVTANALADINFEFQINPEFFLLNF